MAYVEIEYKDDSFEENPHLITWIQLFLIKLISLEEKNKWIESIIEEWDANSQIDIYKYLFDDEMLNSKEKEKWAISFLDKACRKMDDFELSDFASFINEEISNEVDYERLKGILTKHKDMIEKYYHKKQLIVNSSKEKSQDDVVESASKKGNIFSNVQKSNADLIAELKKANPNASNKELAELAKGKIKVPEHPFGYTKSEFLDAQNFLKEKLFKLGIKDAEGFATGSRITGITTNPKKPAFGNAVTDFSKRDLDITIVSSKEIGKPNINKIAIDYKNKFGHKLGIREVNDIRQIPNLPIYGRLEIKIK